MTTSPHVTRRWLTALALLAAALLLAGPAAAQDGEAEAEAAPSPEERVVEIFKDLSSDLNAAGDDCAKAAAALAGWTEENAEEMQSLSKTLEQREQELDQAQLKALEEELAPSMETLIGKAIRCAEDAPFQAAIDNMDKTINGGGGAAEAAP